MNQSPAPASAEGSKFNSDEFLKDELHLTNDQFIQLSKLDGDVFRNYQLLLDRQCEFNFDLLDRLSSENPSKTELDSIANRIGHYQYLMKKQTIRHFLNIRSICTDEQSKLLDNLLKSMMHVGEQCEFCNKKDCERREKLK